MHFGPVLFFGIQSSMEVPPSHHYLEHCKVKGVTCSTRLAQVFRDNSRCISLIPCRHTQLRITINCRHLFMSIQQVIDATTMTHCVYNLDKRKRIYSGHQRRQSTWTRSTRHNWSVQFCLSSAPLARGRFWSQDFSCVGQSYTNVGRSISDQELQVGPTTRSRLLKSIRRSHRQSSSHNAYRSILWPELTRRT